MKILRIIPYLNLSGGGLNQGIRNSIPEMNRLGAINEVLCFDSPDAEFLKTERFLIHALGAAKSACGYNKNFIPWLLHNLGNYNIVIIHCLWLYHSYSAGKDNIFILPLQGALYICLLSCHKASPLGSDCHFVA